ncbi:MAG: hypothetical protein ACU83U_02100 [Gammaproteobacteria bacterium]
MPYIKRWTTLWLAIVLIIASLLFAKFPSIPKSLAMIADSPSQFDPVQIVKTEGSEFHSVILSEKAAQRLGIETALVQEVLIDGIPRLVMPYSSLLYGLHGETWAYISPKALTFVRQAVTVDQIDGDLVFLSKGPASGTQIATVGVSELYGADTGIGK